jgi:murein L,D-transpeptidase YafK
LHKHHIHCGWVARLLLSIAACSGAPGAWAQQDTWLEVDTRQQQVIVRDANDEIVARFDNISIGRGGVSDLHWRGDNTTPRGDYKVTAIFNNSRYGIFIALNYPTLQHADQALDKGKFKPRDRASIAQAQLAGKPPPISTPLGGNIGIHGLGHSSLLVHQQTNWTRGCVALTNEQIGALVHFVEPGTAVKIR